MIEDLDLRERLRAADVPPTRLTTTAMVAAGRRRAGRRRAVRTGCGVAVVAVLAFAGQSLAVRAGGGPADPATGRQDVRLLRCEAAPLTPPPGLTGLQAEAVDPSGRYVLGNVVTRRGTATPDKGEDADFRPVLWTDGQPVALPLLGASVRASGINAAGTVAAVAGRSDTRGHWESVVRYVGGVPEKLEAPAGEWTFAALPKVDQDGHVLAIAFSRAAPRVPVALAWAPTATAATRLPLPAGVEPITVAVTDAGTVIGDVVSRSDPARHTVHVWDQRGGSRRLTTPDAEGAYNFAARGDWVTANLGGSGTVARWDLRTGARTDTGVGAPANGVNALGWVLAGESVHRDDTTVQLAAPGGLTGVPLDVSDTGLVVGSTYDYGAAGPTPQPTPGGGPGSYTWQCRL